MLILLYGSNLYSLENQLAFPSAEGFGKYTQGGTGGKVVIVKSLGDFGSAVKTKGKKTIVFQVSGEVKSPGTIPSGTTIAGQTAPGDGICIRGQIGLGNDVILRYVRVRGGNDAIGKKGGSDIILDHVSASWSVDETVSIYHCKNVTIQWCLIAEPLGPEHGYGGIWGGPQNSFHHNLFAHCQARAPRFSGGIENNDYRNNVCYNWEVNSMYGGEAVQNGGGASNYSYINVIANYYKAGPAAANDMLKYRIVDPWKNTGYGKWYIKDNYVHGYPEVTADNWDGGEYGGVQIVGYGTTPLNDRSMKTDEPAPFIPINQDTPEIAYEKVLKRVGCSFPNRDALDARIIEEVKTGTAKYGKNGIVSKISESSGYGTLKSTTPPKDSDSDGIPDDYETKMGLNPNNAKDATEKGMDGFTNLVLYCESLISEATKTKVEKWATQKKLKLTHSFLSYAHASPSIEYQLPSKSKVTLEVFNVMGKHIATLVNEIQGPGNHSVSLNRSHFTTGFYAYKFTSAGQSVFRRMFLIQ